VIQPKVVLIGGPPGAGKTTLGRALAKRLHGDSLTADDLALAARAITTPETHPGLHRMNVPTAAEYFTNSSVEKLIDDAAAQHRAMWAAIERVIRVRAKEDTSIVIDGWFMRPADVVSLELDNVSSFWLNVDRSVLEERERSVVSFFERSDDPERMLQNFLGRSFWYNDLIRREAEEHGMRILYQDGTKTVDSLCEQALKFLP